MIRRHPLSEAIAIDLAADRFLGRLHASGSDQQAGVGDNSLQPVQGASRCDGQPEALPPPEEGDTLHLGSGQPSDDEEEEPSVGGALPGEHDYLDAHDLIDWDQAPFAATAWAIGRPAATESNPEPAPIARWLWQRDGKVAGELAPTFDVHIHPGRGMTLRRPGVDDSVIQRVRPRLVVA